MSLLYVTGRSAVCAAAGAGAKTTTMAASASRVQRFTITHLHNGRIDTPSMLTVNTQFARTFLMRTCRITLAPYQSTCRLSLTKRAGMIWVGVSHLGPNVWLYAVTGLAFRE